MMNDELRSKMVNLLHTVQRFASEIDAIEGRLQHLRREHGAAVALVQETLALALTLTDRAQGSNVTATPL